MIPASEFKVEKLTVKIFDNRQQMGQAAARDVAQQMKNMIGEKGEINMIFAAAASQLDFFESLKRLPGIRWQSVTAFQMDEYIGLPSDSSLRLSQFLTQKLMSAVDFKKTYFLNGNAENLQAECQRYGDLLRAHPVDITCMGIGESGHIAFNDPAYADFNDPHLVKIVEPDEISRHQQVRDGYFSALAEMPIQAFTLTIPALMSAKWISCVVPGKHKARAVKAALKNKISAECPATILRTHDNAVLFLDRESARLL
ncbi:glucosamine-6-phosphate deaminase [candidate division KSB1 bacterium]|nr:glucosamine-6-phosphate deaminase [candidate division KSB1 bacterium]